MNNNTFDVSELILPKGIRFNGSLPLPPSQRLVHKSTGQRLNLRTTTKRALRRAVTCQIKHLGKDGVYHVHKTVRGLSGRQWKRYKRWRRSIGEPV